MKALLVLVALVSASAETKKELVLKEVGLAVQIPASFKTERKSKGAFAEFTFLGNSVKGRGRLVIRLVPNDADPEEYQKVFESKLKSEGSVVIAQRMPEVLDAKFAVTKYSKTETKGTAKVETTTISGTLFRSTAKKFSIEVTSATADFESSEPVFNQVIETLRTLEGGPVTDNTAAPSPIKRYIIENKPFQGKPFKGPKSTVVKAGEASLDLFYPGNVTVTGLNDGTYLLRGAGLTNPVSLKFLDGNVVAPESAFNDALNKDLEGFQRVDLRLRFPQRITRSAQTQGDSVLRTGISLQEKPKATCLTTLANNDVYAVIQYEAADPKSVRADWKKINNVIAELSFFKKK